MLILSMSQPVHAAAGDLHAGAGEMKVRLHGSIVGFVTGPNGLAQMGATVLLLNRYGQLMHRTLTNEKGAFGFDRLLPEVYSVRVSQTSFAPASKPGVRVEPGARNFLSIQLSTLVSSIQVIGSPMVGTSLMTDDWKWVLRSSPGTRPVLRWKHKIEAPRPRQRTAQLFSDTQGILRLSAGEASTAHAASLADMGTSFALATSLLGAGRVMLLGNIGYSPASGVPAAGFRTSFRASGEDSFFNPEYKLTVQQVFLPMSGAERVSGPAPGGLPSLRTMSAGVSDVMRVSDRLRLEMGASLDSVNFLSRVVYFSPYGIASYDLGKLGMIEIGYSSGLPPSEVYRARRDEARAESVSDIQRNLAGLSLMPRVTLRDGGLRLQRTTSYEATYRRQFGSRTVTAGVFQERMSDAALTLAGEGAFAMVGNVTPDFNSTSAVFNVGRFSRFGYSASISQYLGDWMTVSLVVGRGGVLRTDHRELPSLDPNLIRQTVRTSQQNAATLRLHGVAPVLGTRYAATYQWTDYRALTPGHMFLTNALSSDPGLNFSIRQPLKAPPFMAGRLELTAEVRNLLAQGYLPLASADGQRLLLIHTPRMMRGGVSFFF